MVSSIAWLGGRRFFFVGIMSFGPCLPCLRDEMLGARVSGTSERAAGVIYLEILLVHMKHLAIVIHEV